MKISIKLLDTKYILNLKVVLGARAKNVFFPLRDRILRNF